MELESLATREDLNKVYNDWKDMREFLKGDARYRKLQEELEKTRKLLKQKQEAIESIAKLSTRYLRPSDTLDEIHNLAKRSI